MTKLTSSRLVSTVKLTFLFDFYYQYKKLTPYRLLLPPLVNLFATSITTPLQFPFTALTCSFPLLLSSPFTYLSYLSCSTKPHTHLQLVKVLFSAHYFFSPVFSCFSPQHTSRNLSALLLSHWTPPVYAPVTLLLPLASLYPTASDADPQSPLSPSHFLVLRSFLHTTNTTKPHSHGLAALCLPAQPPSLCATYTGHNQMAHLATRASLCCALLLLA